MLPCQAHMHTCLFGSHVGTKDVHSKLNSTIIRGFSISVPASITCGAAMHKPFCQNLIYAAYNACVLSLWAHSMHANTAGSAPDG